MKLFNSNWFNSFDFKLWKNHKNKTPKLSNYKIQDTSGFSRIHLRIDEDGSGILLVNANQIIHLNATATFMAYLYLEKTPSDTAIRKIVKKYNIEPEKAHDDYLQIVSQITDLINPDGPCPIHDLNLEIIPPFSTTPSAPYRMDLAVTYRCNNNCAHCYNARPRSYPELDTDMWKHILEHIWELGIPHVVFTGGEPTLRDDLISLVAYAEQTGLITGLNTNGRKLQEQDFVNQLVEAGLDHVQITLESHDAAIHNKIVRSRDAWIQTVQGIKNALESPLYVMTNTTLLRSNSPYLEETLHFLAEIGVPTVGLNALIYSGKGKTVGTGLKEDELEPLLEIARSLTQKYNQKLIWYTPTQYCNFDPMSLDLGIKGCTAALYNMCIEPDGGVIPCQSYYQQVGNFLNDSWESIWNHDLSVYIRERKYVPEKCNACLLLSECGGGCPLLYEDEIIQAVSLDKSNISVRVLK